MVCLLYQLTCHFVINHCNTCFVFKNLITIHHVYLRNENFWDHKAPLNNTWQWRKIMEIKEEVKSSIKDQIPASYSIAKGYKLFLGQQQKQRWCTQVWSKWNIPKHSFILWMAWLNRLATRNRIKRFKDIADDKCVFCSDQQEDTEHLFFTCNWTWKCFNLI